VIDPKTLKIVGTVPTGQAESHMLAITRDGKRGYTANVGPGTVSVLDLAAHKTIAVIPIANHTQRISLSVDDSMVFTSDTEQPRLAVIKHRHQQGGALGDAAGSRLWLGADAGRQVARDCRLVGEQGGVIDLKTRAVAKTIDVPAAPQEVLIRPDGANRLRLLRSDRQDRRDQNVDWAVEKLIDAGKAADGLAWAAK
jgi:DNA-binding beta-propeller fold protein YncE